MATKTKAKPATTKATASAKATPKNLNKKAAAKASTDVVVKTGKPSVVFEVGQLVRFGGYKSNMDADDAVFSEGDMLYITEVDDDSESGILYSCISAKDIAEYEENGDENVSGGQVSPAEVQELKGSALEKAQDTYLPVAIIGKLQELLDEADGNPIDVAINLNRGIQENFFWMGGALAQILQTGAYLKENGGEYSGEEAFNDFCQAEFAFKASKGRTLARIYKTFSAIPDFDASKLAALDWSKVAIAERFVTSDNIDEVLDVAETATQRELAVSLKEKFANNQDGKTASGRASSRGPSIVKKSLAFRLDEDAAETVQLVLQQCMKQNGIVSESDALERICVEWADNHVEADAAKKRIASKAAKAAKARAAVAKEAEAKPAAATKPAPKAKPGKK